MSNKIIYFNSDYNVYTTFEIIGMSFDEFLSSINEWGKSIDIPSEIVGVLSEFELTVFLADLEFNPDKIRQHLYEQMNYENKIINLFGKFEEVETLGTRDNIVLSKDKYKRFHICELSVLDEGIKLDDTLKKIDEVRG